MTAHKKIWLWLLAIVVALILFITFGLPRIGSYYAQRWMLEQGATSAAIEQIRFNPFTGTLAIENVQATFAEGEPVAIGLVATEIHWRSLWSKFIHLNRLFVERANTPIRVSNEQVRVGQLQVWQATPAQESVNEESDATPWQFRLDELQLQDWHLPLTLYGNPAELQIDSFDLAQLDTSQTDTPIHVEFRGKINNDPVIWGTDVTPFAPQPVISGTWQLEQLDLAEFTPFLGEDMQQLRGTLGSDTKLHVEFREQGIFIEQQGDLQLNQFVLPEVFEVEAVNWSGQLTLLLTLEDDVGELDLAGDLDAQAVAPVLPDMDIALDSLRWSGDLAMAALNDVQTLSARSGVTVSSLSVNDGVNSQTGRQLQLQKLTIEPGLQVELGSLSLQDLTLASNQAPDAELVLKRLLLSDVGYAEADGVRIREQQLTDLKLSLGRNEQSEWQLPYMPVASQEKTQSADGDASDPLAIQIDQILLTGDSTISLNDQTVKPVASNVIQIAQLQVQDIETGNASTWANFDLQLRQGDYGKLAFVGKLRQPGVTMDLDMSGDIEQMDLTPWSSYLSSATGYQVKHGVLDSTLDIEVEQGALDAFTEVHLHNLEVERVDASRAQQMEATMSMPLDSALSMLRDDDNNIELKIPVSGDLQSPDFDISNVMNKAIATALKKTTVTYLKYALQPYGALLILGEAVGSQVGKVGFTPVEFDPGQAELNQAAIEYMARLGGILEQRPEMRLQLCGVATVQDLPEEQLAALRKQQDEQASLTLDEDSKATLLAIAEQRAARVKQFLVEKYSVEPGRLFTCLPKYELQPEALPRVDVSL